MAHAERCTRPDDGVSSCFASVGMYGLQSATVRNGLHEGRASDRRMSEAIWLHAGIDATVHAPLGSSLEAGSHPARPAWFVHQRSVPASLACLLQQLESSDDDVSRRVGRLRFGYLMFRPCC